MNEIGNLHLSATCYTQVTHPSVIQLQVSESIHLKAQNSLMDKAPDSKSQGPRIESHPSHFQQTQEIKTSGSEDKMEIQRTQTSTKEKKYSSTKMR